MWNLSWPKERVGSRKKSYGTSIWHRNLPLVKLALWHSSLGHHLQCQLPIWVPVQIPIALILMQFLDNGLGKQQRVAQEFGHLEEAPDSWLSPSHCAHKWSKPQNGKSISPFHFHNSAFSNK